MPRLAFPIYDEPFGATIPVEVEANAEAAGAQLLGRQSNQRTGVVMSNDFIQISQAWLDECSCSHDSCRQRCIFQPTRLPKRLIDVTGVDSVQIIHCEAWLSAGLARVNDLERYCTLSYQWGVPAHDCVLAETFPQTLVLEVHTMPRTFRDAIVVARRLGFRFLWIDALCIVQQDRRELEEEVSRMGDIYERSECTIAATAALTVHDGFLRALDAYTSTQPCPTNDESSLQSGQSTTLFERTITNSSLNKRGWVMQERALSRRTLYCTSVGVFWECGTIKANWQYPEGYSIYATYGLSPCRQSREGLLSIARIRQAKHFCPAEWEHFVQRYSRAEFTKMQDRLFALSAVARAVEPILGHGEYLAGLWKNRLRSGILWECVGHKNRRRLQPPIAPTWSWASVNSPVVFASSRLGNPCMSIATIIDASVVPDSAHCPYGSARIGWLTIKGPLAWVLLPAGRAGDVAGIAKAYTTVSWDEGWHPYRDAHYESCYILILGHKNAGFGDKTTMDVIGLILKSIRPSDQLETAMGSIPGGVFRRIGWFERKISKHELQVDVDWYFPDLSEEKREEMKSDPWTLINRDPQVCVIC
jgi:Heterokaryon incompatibility protein (HET)